MKIAVRYYTRSGNTKKLADAVASALAVPAKDVSVPLEEKTELLFLGSSMYAADVNRDVKDFLQANAGKIGRIVCFSTAAVAHSTYKQVKKLADAAGIDIAEEEFACRGSFGIMHRDRPNDRDLQNATNFAKGIVKKYF